MTRQRGFALVIVLWSIVLLALLGTQLVASGRTDLRLTANLRAAADAEAAADGAVHQAIFHLLDPARPWVPGQTPYEVRQPGVTVVVQLDDEAGKVNPNTAPQELLRALLREAGADTRTAEQLAARIVDWRFPGDAPRPGGAKAPQYRAAGLDYGPPDAPFQTIDELGAVLGMTPELLARLRPFLSLLNDDPPDLAVASPGVRQALVATFGPQPPPNGQRPPVRNVTITAEASTDRGGRFTRQATVRLGTARQEPLYQILTWTAGS